MGIRKTWITRDEKGFVCSFSSNVNPELNHLHLTVYTDLQEWCGIRCHTVVLPHLEECTQCTTAYAEMHGLQRTHTHVQYPHTQ